MQTALMRFVFRAKVRLHVMPDVQALGCNERTAQTALGGLPDGDALAGLDGNIGLRLPGSGPRWLVLSAVFLLGPPLSRFTPIAISVP